MIWRHEKNLVLFHRISHESSKILFIFTHQHTVLVVISRIEESRLESKKSYLYECASLPYGKLKGNVQTHKVISVCGCVRVSMRASMCAYGCKRVVNANCICVIIQNARHHSLFVSIGCCYFHCVKKFQLAILYANIFCIQHTHICIQAERRREGGFQTIIGIFNDCKPIE